jgi:hypothetical protein
MASDEQIFTLHRYFVWASRQRHYFFDGVPETEFPEDPEASRNWVRTQFVNLCYWMASLYVVVEGWRDLKLSDAEIDTLLESPHVAALRRFRNGVFHFQKNYFDDRFIGLFEEGGPVWASTLHKAFSRFFIGWFNARGIKVTIGKENDGGTTAYVSLPEGDET